MQTLISLDAAVARRTASIVSSHPSWPCRKGCDACCRNLAAVPVLTEPEWLRLRNAIAELPPDARDAAVGRVLALSPGQRPLTCPLLDTGSGACLVYAARPVACRTYGFYADREAGLYCTEVAGLADAHPEIVWGNQESVEADLDAMGSRRDLREWLAREQR